jgi:hypothetical protein
MLTPSRNFDAHSYIWQHVKNIIGPKGEIYSRYTMRRVNAIGQLLRRVRCSKKVQRAAKAAGLPNPKWALA